MKSVGDDVHQKIEISIDYRPFGEAADRHQECEIPLRDEPNGIIQKGFALSVYCQTMREFLPEAGMCKELFDKRETEQFHKLRAFLVGQPPEISSDLVLEIEMVDRLILDNCDAGDVHQSITSYLPQLSVNDKYKSHGNSVSIWKHIQYRVSLENPSYP